MSALTLARYHIKRLARRKWLMPALYALPLVGAIIRLIFPNSVLAPVVTWACPLLCAAMLGGVLYAQRSVDHATGLLAGLRSLPLPNSVLIGSSIVAGIALFATQMAVFGGVHSIFSR